jgi:hypothetical protein
VLCVTALTSGADGRCVLFLHPPALIRRKGFNSPFSLGHPSVTVSVVLPLHEQGAHVADAPITNKLSSRETLWPRR